MGNIMNLGSNLSYIECSDNPLSADIGIVETENGTWLYDVGNNPSKLVGLDDKYNIVLSHFHADHIGALKCVQAKEIYSGKFTYDHIKCGNIVNCDLYIDGLHIFPIPSSHAKGCVGLETGDYAFVGDAIYSKVDATHYIYNAQLLKSEIAVLKSLKASKLLVSHYPGLIRERLAVIDELEQIYKMYRVGDSPEIRVPR